MHSSEFAVLSTIDHQQALHDINMFLSPKGIIKTVHSCDIEIEHAEPIQRTLILFCRRQAGVHAAMTTYSQ